MAKQKNSLQQDVRDAGISQKDQAFLDQFSDQLTTKSAQKSEHDATIDREASEKLEKAKDFD